MADWLGAHQFERNALLEGIEALHFEFDTRDDQTVKDVAMSRNEVIENFVFPALDRLLGPNVLKSALHGKLVITKSPWKSQPYTMDEGPDKPLRVHAPWRGRFEEVIWLTHEVAHAAQLSLSKHQLMPPIARETCAFWAELALLDYAKCVDPTRAADLRSAWHRHSTTYLVGNLESLKEALKTPNGPYRYCLNYPLARLGSLFLSQRKSTLNANAFFSSGREAMKLICFREVLFEFQSKAKRYRRLTASAATEILLQHVEDGFRCQVQPTLSIVQGEKIVRTGRTKTVPGMDQWRSKGIQALAALKRGEADVTPAKFLEVTEKNMEPPSSSARPGPFDAFAAIGLAMHHLAWSSYHRNFVLSYYLPVEIFPALKLGQLETFVLEDGTPVGLVTWARLSKVSETEILATGRALKECEWRNGTNLFFNDWITEQYSFRRIVSELRRNVFPNEFASSLRRNKTGSVRRINRWKGENAATIGLAGKLNANAERDGSLAATTCCAGASKPRMCTCSPPLPQKMALGAPQRKGKSSD